MSSKTSLKRGLPPGCTEEWGTSAKRQKVSHTHPSDLPHIFSASKATEEQFLALRPIWPPRKSIQNCPFPYVKGKGPLYDRAKEYLKGFESFQEFLKLSPFEHDLSNQKLGGFAAVVDALKAIPKNERSEAVKVSDTEDSISSREVSLEFTSPEPPASEITAPMTVLSGQTMPSEHTALGSLEEPPRKFAKDEQVVNDGLFRFTTALTVPIPDVKVRWCSDRNPFDNIQFGALNMEARTDGYLAAEVGGEAEVYAIAEVKTKNRDIRKRPDVLWQETCEVVGWMGHEDKHGTRRDFTRPMVLLSQDHTEVFMTLAPWTPQYSGKGGYLFKKPLDMENAPFQEFQCYGPWNMHSPSNLEDLATRIVAIAMQASDDIEKATSS